MQLIMHSSVRRPDAIDFQLAYLFEWKALVAVSVGAPFANRIIAWSGHIQ